MARIADDQIHGLKVDGKIVCARCATQEEWAKAVQHDIITTDQIDSDEAMYFCDRCGERL